MSYLFFPQLSCIYKIAYSIPINIMPIPMEIICKLKYFICLEKFQNRCSQIASKSNHVICDYYVTHAGYFFGVYSSVI